MGRRRKTNRHLPQHVYVRRGRYQLRKKSGHAENFETLDECLLAWAVEYGGRTGEYFRDVVLDYQTGVLPSKAGKTQVEYRASLGRLGAVFGHMRLRDIKPVHIYDYQCRRGEGPAANRDVAVLSAVCSRGVKLGLIDENPCRQVRRAPEKPRRRFVTDEEFLMVLNLAPNYVQNAMWLTLITGMRLGDIFDIGPHNFTEDGFLYTQGKTGREMLIEWTDSLREAARRPPVSYSGFQTAWQRLMKKAVQKGLRERFTFHDLRAKAGSEAKDWRLLGHTDRKTFERIYNRKPVKISLK